MAEPKFVIQGVDYPVPEWVSFTIDESEILHDKAKLTLDQIDEDIPFSPGLLSTMLIVSYMRGNPGTSRSKAEKIVGPIKLTDAIEHLASKEDEESPPAPAPSETETPGAPENSDESTTSSGSDGVNGSGSQDVVRLRTGMPESDTPPTSDQETLVS